MSTTQKRPWRLVLREALVDHRRAGHLADPDSGRAGAEDHDLLVAQPRAGRRPWPRSSAPSATAAVPWMSSLKVSSRSR